MGFAHINKLLAKSNFTAFFVNPFALLFAVPERYIRILKVDNHFLMPFRDSFQVASFEPSPREKVLSEAKRMRGYFLPVFIFVSPHLSLM